MAAIGVTNLNCTTYYDRTNFFEALPTSGLDRTLYLEAHRMGHLLDDFSEKRRSLRSAGWRRTKSGKMRTHLTHSPMK